MQYLCMTYHHQTNIPTYIHTHTHTYIHHLQTNIHTYIHTYIHKYIHSTYAAIGFAHHLKGSFDTAIDFYHKVCVCMCVYIEKGNVCMCTGICVCI